MSASCKRCLRAGSGCTWGRPVGRASARAAAGAAPGAAARTPPRTAARATAGAASRVSAVGGPQRGRGAGAGGAKQGEEEREGRDPHVRDRSTGPHTFTRGIRGRGARCPGQETAHARPVHHRGAPRLGPRSAPHPRVREGRGGARIARQGAARHRLRHGRRRTIPLPTTTATISCSPTRPERRRAWRPPSCSPRRSTSSRSRCSCSTCWGGTVRPRSGACRSGPSPAASIAGVARRGRARAPWPCRARGSSRRGAIRRRTSRSPSHAAERPCRAGRLRRSRASAMSWRPVRSPPRAKQRGSAPSRRWRGDCSPP